jgi:predicted amidophosphoribosyltransferase
MRFWRRLSEDWHPGSIPALPPDVICPKCRKSDAPGTRTCKQCETPLDPPACPQCGAPVEYDARYCTRCGGQVN